MNRLRKQGFRASSATHLMCKRCHLILPQTPLFWLNCKGTWKFLMECNPKMHCSKLRNQNNLTHMKQVKNYVKYFIRSVIVVSLSPSLFETKTALNWKKKWIKNIIFRKWKRKHFCVSWSKYAKIKQKKFFYPLNATRKNLLADMIVVNLISIMSGDDSGLRLLSRE